MSTSEALSVPRELDTVTNHLLDEHVDSLAYGNSFVQNAALQAAKHIFDTSLGTEMHSKVSIDNLLSSLNPLQKPTTRSQAKADNLLPQTSLNKTFVLTPLSSLLIEGMDQEQVWMQLDLRSQMICDLLNYALETGKNEEDLSAGEEDEEGEDDDDRLQNITEAIKKGEQIDLEDIREELGEDVDVDEESVEEDDESESSENVVDDTEHIVQLRSDEEQSDNEDPTTLFDVIKASSRSKRKKHADHGLNDDFFDLDAFNAEIEQAEAKSSSRGQLANSDSDSEDEDMSLDLFAPVDEEIDEQEDTGDVFYRDFFDLPRNANSRSKVKVSSNRESKVRFHDEVRVKKIKPKGKNLPLSLLRGMDALNEDYDEDGDDDGDDIDIDLENKNEGGWLDDEPMEDGEISDGADERADGVDSSSQSQASDEDDSQTMERFKDDLFAEDEENGHDDDMTTHEKHQATLREQIAQMEDENVAKKDWTLMGEADSRSRPQNSLLEEDLEFEHVMKAAPVISEEIVQGLEQRIKARILENRFDDVIRVRPVEDKPFLPSRMFELQDTKSTQSLAQLYENDYLASQSGAGNKGDEKVKKQHEDIEKDWEKICNKLDALCNAHFVPKQPKAIISTVSNVATASMESALPTAMATKSILAPEEVFNPAGAETRSRSELSPSDKRALHTKERKAKKRQRDILEKSRNKVTKPTKGIGNLKKEKQAVLNSIVKTGKGVTVVGKQAKSSLSSKKRPKSQTQYHRNGASSIVHRT